MESSQNNERYVGGIGIAFFIALANFTPDSGGQSPKVRGLGAELCLFAHCNRRSVREWPIEAVRFFYPQDVLESGP